MAQRKTNESYAEKSPEVRTRSKWGWIAIGVFLVLLLVYFIYSLAVDDTQAAAAETMPLALEGDVALEKITELNRDDILPIDERWEEPLMDGDYEEARQRLESLLSNTMEMSEFTRHAYFLGLLYLYAPGPEKNLDRAIEYLKVGRQFRSDANLYLIKAYLESGQQQKALDLLDKNPGLQEQLPESFLDQLGIPYDSELEPRK